MRRLRALGVTPVLVDDAPAGGDFEGLPTRRTDDGLEALLRCDVVVKSPGISRYRPEIAQFEAAGVPVRGGLGLWLEETDRTQVACITGTKGKSTTTALCVHLLQGLGLTAAAGGNIGRPPWDTTADDDPAVWVIETSSFQVTDITTAPGVVAVTSLSPDHLDWHGSVERYYADKLSLCTKPGVEVALVQREDAALRQQSGALGPHVQWVNAPSTPAVSALVQALDLPGAHNARNAAVAHAVLHALGIDGADDPARLAEAAHGFTGLPSRCRPIGQVGGIEFVDDSLSTNVLPAQAALAAYADRPVALLVGGKDRGLDYGPLGQTVADRRASTLVVTLPDNGPRIGASVRAVAPDAEVVDAADLDDAVALEAFCLGIARHGDIAVAGGPQLRALRRLSGPGPGLCRRGRPLRHAQLISRLSPEPARRAR